MENVNMRSAPLEKNWQDLRGPNLKPGEVNQLIENIPHATVAELDDICAKLRNKADACMDAKDQSTYDEIYTRLIDIGIRLELDRRFFYAFKIYGHLCGPSENNRPAFNTALQKEAAMRKLIIDRLPDIDEGWKDPEGTLRQLYATAAGTPGRSMPAYQLGKMYQEGKPEGMEQNNEKSLELYKKAAEEGCKPAQVALTKLETKMKADAVTKQLNDQKIAEEMALMEKREREFSEITNNLKCVGYSQRLPDWYDDDQTYREKVANIR